MNTTKIKTKLTAFFMAVFSDPLNKNISYAGLTLVGVYLIVLFVLIIVKA